MKTSCLILSLWTSNLMFPLELRHQNRLTPGIQTVRLYILQIIFEIEAKREKNQDVLLIFDDVADSFDYRNKYAIIEYINDIKESNNFKSIIMTHNFDFYRTLGSRLCISRENIFMVSKNEEREIKLERGEYLKAVINDLKKKSENSDIKAFISLIPFVRNLIEYTKGENDNDYIILKNLPLIFQCSFILSS